MAIVIDQMIGSSTCFMNFEVSHPIAHPLTTEKTMTLGELRKLTAHLPDETEIGYKDPNFAGKFREPFDSSSVHLPDPKEWDEASKTHILISIPSWEECD